jgi:hypothetical protein
MEEMKAPSAQAEGVFQVKVSSFLAGDVGGDLGLQMQVQHMQNPPAAQVDLGVQDGPLPLQRVGALVGGVGGGDLVGRAGAAAVTDDRPGVIDQREPAQDHQVAFLVQVTTGRGGREPLVVLIAGAGQQAIEGGQGGTLGTGLTVDLLETQHIGGDALELGPHDRDARIQGWILTRFVVEVLQVERRDAHSSPLS